MTSIEETAYPRFKGSYSKQELNSTYCLSTSEIDFIEKNSKRAYNQILFAIYLKCAQRLGYFCPIEEIPHSIIMHLAKQFGFQISFEELKERSQTRTAKKYQKVIREYLNIQSFDDEAKKTMITIMKKSAEIKDEPADLINDALEELIRNCYMLPPFSTVNHLAKQIRSDSYLEAYQKISIMLTANDRRMIDQLFVIAPEGNFSLWNELRLDVKRASLSQLKTLLELNKQLKNYQFDSDISSFLHYSKIEQMALEASTCNAAQMKEMKSLKREALAAVYVQKEIIRCKDDLADMLIKRILAVHKKGKQKLADYREKTQLQTDDLIKKFHHLLTTYQTADTEQRLDVIDDLLQAHGVEYLDRCEEYLMYGDNNYLPFLLPLYKAHRSVLFKVLNELDLDATSQDTNMTESIFFLKTLQHKKVELIPVSQIKYDWFPVKWKSWLQSKDQPKMVLRKRYEIAVFTLMIQELKTGDLYVSGSEKYADYRTQLVSWEEYHQEKESFCEQLSLPMDPEDFIYQRQSVFYKVANSVDQALPSNTTLSLENGTVTLRRVEGVKATTELKEVEKYLQNTISERSILDILKDTLIWLNWARYFGPVSKHEDKLQDPLKSYLATTFCYGTNLGTSQTARSLGDLNRKHLAWINNKHIDVESIEKSIHLTINAYNRFRLPKYWGNGSSVSADGTKWNIYEQNLLSEYHIRYGGYGGIGYYHVSDTYIALFSNFIPCGVWEGVYILDLMMKQEQIDIDPQQLHSDTQGQSEPIFGLAHLLGIELMPRIRNLKELKFYHPDKDISLANIDSLFSENINWDLIATHYDDMLRVVMSIKVGKIYPSTILTRLNSYSKKNKLYKAFRELGRVIRTQFLLRYISSYELRQFIQGATNKNESFNNFTQWLFFGGDQTIRENNRDSQKKIIKYNHLIANCIIFYNVFVVSKALEQYKKDTGKDISEETVKKLSPYLTTHINRFGKYEIDLTQKPTQISYDFTLG